MQIYRCLQILTSECNAIISDYVLLVIGNLLIFIAVVSNIMLIKCHTKLGFDILFLFIIISIGANLYILILYLTLGEVNSVSKKLILRRIRNTAKDSRQDIILKKFLKSCKKFLGIHLNSFGYYQKPTSIRIIGKIIMYTVKFLMMTKGVELWLEEVPRRPLCWLRTLFLQFI